MQIFYQCNPEKNTAYEKRGCARNPDARYPMCGKIKHAEYAQTDGRAGNRRHDDCAYKTDWFTRIVSIVAIVISLIVLIARSLQ